MWLLRACRNRETTLLKKAGWPVRGWLRMAEDGFHVSAAFNKKLERFGTRRGDKPGRTCHTRRSPSWFVSDWFCHSHVAVGSRRISASILARAVSVSSESRTFRPYAWRTVVPAEAVWSLGPFTWNSW